MIGAAISGGLSLAGGIFGAIARARALKRQRKVENETYAENTNYLNRDRYSNAFNRSDTRAALAKTMENLRANTRAAAARAGIMGIGGDQTYAQMASRGSDAMAANMQRIMAGEQQRRDQLDNQQRQLNAQHRKALASIKDAQSAQLMQSVTGIAQAGGQFASAMLENNNIMGDKLAKHWESEAKSDSSTGNGVA